MRFETVEAISRTEAEKAFGSLQSEKIVDALVRLTLSGEDPAWAAEKCFHYAESGDLKVQGTAITCLGHLARLGHPLDLERLRLLFRSLESKPELSGRIEDLQEDLLVYAEYGQEVV